MYNSFILMLLLSLIIGCSSDIDYNTEKYENKIPMGGDSVLSYQATSYYKNKGEDDCSFMGCADPGYHRRLSVTIDYCVETGGVQKSCVKGIPYFTNTDQPLISTYEKGVYILDFVSDTKAVGGVKYLQKIWNWETGGYSEDTLVQSEDLFSVRMDNEGLNHNGKFKLLTVAETDSGYFLRLRREQSSYEGRSYYLSINRDQKTIQNASMDSVEIVEMNGWKHKVPKCKLGQWSYEGNKICGIQDDSYSLSTAKAAVILNDSTIINCPGGWGGGFFRFFYTNKRTIKPINIRNLTSDLNDVGREYFKQDGECQ